MLGDFPSSMLGTVAIMSCKLETLVIMSQGMWKSYINWILKNKKINNAGKRERRINSLKHAKKDSSWKVNWIISKNFDSLAIFLGSTFMHIH